MSGETFADPKVKALIEANFVLVKLDVDRQAEAAGWFAGSGIPDV
jgi:uncharacterized protein YyaL (SSP411 family)